MRKHIPLLVVVALYAVAIIVIGFSPVAAAFGLLVAAVIVLATRRPRRS